MLERVAVEEIGDYYPKSVGKNRTGQNDMQSQKYSASYHSSFYEGRVREEDVFLKDRNSFLFKAFRAALFWTDTACKALKMMAFLEHIILSGFSNTKHCASI